MDIIFAITYLFIFLYHDVSPQSPSSAENLERCDFRNRTSCNKVFGKHPTEMTEEEFSEAPCFCDEDCFPYGDCCIDSAFSQFFSTNTSSFECVPLGKIDYHVYIKTQCSIFWKDKRIKELCEMPDVRDTISQLYVTNLAYNITYSNLYCAICNGESVDLLIPWEMNLLKYFPIGAETISSPLKLFLAINHLLLDKWDYGEQLRNSISSSLRVTNFPPLGIRGHIRRCKANIRTCAKDYTNKQIRQNCATQSHYVYHIGTYKLYRNMDCALCNNVSPNDMACLDDADTLNIICPPMFIFSDVLKTCQPVLPNLPTQVNMTTDYPVILCKSGYKQLGPLCVPEKVISGK